MARRGAGAVASAAGADRRCRGARPRARLVCERGGARAGRRAQRPQRDPPRPGMAAAARCRRARAVCALLRTRRRFRPASHRPRTAVAGAGANCIGRTVAAVSARPAGAAGLRALQQLEIPPGRARRRPDKAIKEAAGQWQSSFGWSESHSPELRLVNRGRDPFADAQRFAEFATTSHRVYDLLERGNADATLDPQRLVESWSHWHGAQEEAE